MEHWHPRRELIAYSHAEAAIARAAETCRLARHPVILNNRLRTLQLEALGVLEGVAVLPDSLATRFGYEDEVVRLWPFTFSRLVEGVPPLDDVPDAARIATWLQQAEVDLPGLEGWRDAVVADGGASDVPRLLLSASMAFEWQYRFPDVPAGGVMLADLFAHHGTGCSIGGIVAIGFLAAGTRWKRLVQQVQPADVEPAAFESGRERCRSQWLQALVDGAESVVQLEDVIAEWVRQVGAAVRDRRSSSQLRALCELIVLRPSTSVSQAASLLDMSRQSAARLIAEAEGLNLIREMSHGKYMRRYCATI